MGSEPVIYWVRRDLRLADNAALAAALATGAPVIPVFIHDETIEAMGAAPRFRLGLGLEVFGKAVAAAGARLVLRRGRALEVLRALVAETGAGCVMWNRLYDPESVARDTDVKAALRSDGLRVASHAGHVLFEPPTVETGQGGPYRVYTPFWRAVRDRDVAASVAAPGRWAVPDVWPAGDRLADWNMPAGMRRGADIVAAHACVGEAAARDRLDQFIDRKIDTYATARDLVGQDGKSNLSENLCWGEISAAACWHAGQRALQAGRAGAETFLKELVWRDFAHHLAFHTPRLLTGNWRAEWDSFPWETDRRRVHVRAWERGRTGVPFVDAGLRQMYVTGRMHNRARMVVASYLTKHLMTHWLVGAAWFADCLTDWDPASNAMGWQWVAGSGPDAAPYFRVFNPDTQLQKFDPAGDYARAWIAEGRSRPSATALSYFDAVPESWHLAPGSAYPAPVVSLADGRARALAAYQAR